MTSNTQTNAQAVADAAGSAEPVHEQAMAVRRERAIVSTSGYALGLIEDNGSEVLTVAAPDGQLCLRMVLGPDGPMVEVQAASLHLAASADIRVDCERLELNARQQMTLHGRTVDATADCDLRVHAGGLFASEAHAQTHRARLGNIELKANDDVALDGEQIRLNSPKPSVAPTSWPNLGPVQEQPSGYITPPDLK